MSEPIQFRLPIATYERLDALSAAAGQTPADYVRDLILTTKLGSAPVAGVAVVPARCRHAQREVLGGGLARCKDCGSTRNMKGVWS